MSPALQDIDLLHGFDDFTKLYFDFCELAMTGKDSGAVMRDLRKLVDDELKRANQRVKDFTTLRKKYAEGGRRDLAVFMQKNVEAARGEGFKEGVSSAEESQQIYGELEKIDESLLKIGETLKGSQEYWEKLDQTLKSPPSAPPGQQAEVPPGGITTGHAELCVQHQAEKIRTGLYTVCQATLQYANSKKVLKTGKELVKHATDLREDCTTLVLTHSSVEVELWGQGCAPKRSREALSPLRKGLKSAVKGYEKLSLRFTKYAEMIYLLFWFAGTTVAEKMGMENPDHVAHAVLLSKGLSSYVLPFESAFMGIEHELRGIQDFWRKAESMKDGPGVSSAWPLINTVVKGELVVSDGVERV
ncbi:hypothetical protein B0H14DRAFT_3423927 [Mycena olivaceomarginata]|nr:hypothetical protein B0H14DRAFT_3423927 [Mycena olivaceomarginata]